MRKKISQLHFWKTFPETRLTCTEVRVILKTALGRLYTSLASYHCKAYEFRFEFFNYWRKCLFKSNFRNLKI